MVREGRLPNGDVVLLTECCYYYKKTPLDIIPKPITQETGEELLKQCRLMN